MRRLPGPAGWPTGRRSLLPRLHRIVSGLAVNPNSIFCEGPTGSETANRCPVLRRQEPSPRGTTCELGDSDRVGGALLPKRASGELFFLLTLTYIEVGHPEAIRRSSFLNSDPILLDSIKRNLVRGLSWLAMCCAISSLPLFFRHGVRPPNRTPLRCGVWSRRTSNRRTVKY